MGAKISMVKKMKRWAYDEIILKNYGKLNLIINQQVVELRTDDLPVLSVESPDGDSYCKGIFILWTIAEYP